MATKKSAGSKKETASKVKKDEILGNDPPIIVSGGGGGPVANGNRPPNNVFVGFHPKGGPGAGNFQSETNNEAVITGVEISFPGMPGVASITLNNYAMYNIQIRFITGSTPRSGQPGASTSRKGNTSGKRSAKS